MIQLLGLPIAAFFAGYATSKYLWLAGGRREVLNLLATGRVETLVEFAGRAPSVVVVMPSYNEGAIDETLPRWLRQDYPKYWVVVAEDGEKSFDYLGEGMDCTYDYTLPDGKRQTVRIEVWWRAVVVRRDNRRGFKPGALNNVLHLIETGVLRDLAGVETPDYVIVVDADHEPGRNRLLRLLLGKREYENKPLDDAEYEKVGGLLKRYEEVGREILNVDSYRLEPRAMDDPHAFVTRAVELAEYHRWLVPRLAMVQGYQNHYAVGGGLGGVVKATYVLAQYALALRSPSVRVVRDYRRVHGPRNRPSRLRRFKHVKKVVRYDGIYRVYVSGHSFPLFMGSSGIIRGDLLLKYKFADGVFTPYLSITEDWELSIRLQTDGYYIFATHQLETWGRPPESIRAYLSQQERWAEGTMRDIRRHFWRVMKSRHLGPVEKLGFLYQASHYVGGFLFLEAIALTSALVALGLLAPTLDLALQSAYYLSANVVPDRLYGAKTKDLLAKMFIVAPTYAKAVLRGLFTESGEWIVTKKNKNESAIGIETVLLNTRRRLSIDI